MAESMNLLAVYLLLLSFVISRLVCGNAAVPAIYILGDSTVDVGTNNHFNDTLAKADFQFYGIDFPGSVATGRFSNGFNTADFICKVMGFQMSPKPFLDLIDNSFSYNDSINGVNFASAAAGILDDTGKWYGKVVRFSEQIEQFKVVREKLENLLGVEATNTRLAKSIFVVCMGSNDIFQYVTFNSSRNETEFMPRLSSTYETRLRALYSLGARKFGVLAVGPLGCTPSERIRNHTGDCFYELNEYSLKFYTMAEALYQKLSSELRDMKYSLGNTNEIMYEMINHPHRYDFKDAKAACCGGGLSNSQVPCSPYTQVCPHRRDFLFWDRHHPTEAAVQLGVQTLYRGSTRFVKPINFKQLESDN